MDQNQLAQYMTAYQNAFNNPSSIGMTSGGATNGLQQFFNSPTYTLLYGSQQATNNSNAAAAGTYNPVNAFQQDPGYQFALQQGTNALQNSYAAKGLLQSGAFAKDLDAYSQGLANQNYQQYLGQQNSLFSNYQNQLAGLTNLGAQSTGAQNAMTTGQSLANILSGANLTTGQNIANANLGTGSNISSLFANQGSLNAGAMLNTAAAQANNIFQGNAFQAQLNAANLASNAGTRSSINNSNSLSGSLF